MTAYEAYRDGGRMVVLSATLVALMAARLRTASALLVGMAEELEGSTRMEIHDGNRSGAGADDQVIKLDDQVIEDWSVLEEYRLAQAVEGEGAGLFEDRVTVGLWIAHTALNRVEKGWWGESLVEVVERDFHGWVNVTVPADWAREIARTVLGRKEDITGGALFVLSRQDLEKNGWSSEEAMFSFEEGGASGEAALFFFRVWPGDE